MNDSAGRSESAFPTAGYERGMILRDWFAGQALVAWLSTFAHSKGPEADMDAESFAADAYKIADAMLAERAKGASS